MLKTTVFPLAFLMFVLLITSCQRDEVIEEMPEPDISIDGYPGVEEDLWVYFERFEEEARARGYDIDLIRDEITGVIREIEDGGVAGECTYSSHQPNHVTIDKTFWDGASDRYREFVVFHELGHCDLGRDHREAANQAGLCLSIMRSGLGDCRDAYNSVNREVYLDELFDPAFRDELGN